MDYENWENNDLYEELSKTWKVVSFVEYEDDNTVYLKMDNEETEMFETTIINCIHLCNYYITERAGSKFYLAYGNFWENEENY